MESAGKENFLRCITRLSNWENCRYYS